MTPGEQFSIPDAETKASDAPACNLSPEELEAKRRNLIPGILRVADEVREVDNGLHLVFKNGDGLLATLLPVMEFEQKCCSFLRFALTIEPNLGPITLDVTGPPGTREMLLRL
jgi:hypothetical protein